jgi:hypothetical protein
MELFNRVIHLFLESEIFGGELNIEATDKEIVSDEIENLLPKYLFREQYHKCLQVFEELYYWTADKFYHRMSAFHELALYRFIQSMANFWRDDPKVFDSIFYDAETRLLIKAAAESDHQEYGEISLEEYEESYLDVAAYSDYLFEELDFELIPDLHNRRMLGDVSLESHLGITLDFYFELLPSRPFCK